MRFFLSFLYKLLIGLWFSFFYFFGGRVDNARVFILKGDHVLIVRHRFSKEWSIPGGMIKKKESFSEGLRRELREELGVTLPDFLEKLGRYYEKAFLYFRVFEIYIARVEDSFEVKKVQAFEVEDYLWVKISDYDSYRMSPEIKKRFQDLLSGSVNIDGAW